MSECITREERAFLHALAHLWGPHGSGNPGDTARALLASLEAAPPAPECPECGVTLGQELAPEYREDIQIPSPRKAESISPAPKPGRVEERTTSVTEVSYVLDRIIGERDLAERFREELNYVRDQYKAERAEHEALRERVERAREKLGQFAGKPYPSSHLAASVRAILDGTEKAP
jgi:hypothetical protein